VTAILTIDNVSHRFGSLWAVRDVSFSVERGELLGLIGPNGAGKSTLYNLIAGALIPTKGEIFFDGLKSLEIASRRSRRHCAHVSDTEAISSTVGRRKRDADGLSARTLGKPRKGSCD
jgi:ABC-type multidrug transport system ATPase subunit